MIASENRTESPKIGEPFRTALRGAIPNNLSLYAILREAVPFWAPLARSLIEGPPECAELNECVGAETKGLGGH